MKYTIALALLAAMALLCAGAHAEDSVETALTQAEHADDSTGMLKALEGLLSADATDVAEDDSSDDDDSEDLETPLPDEEDDHNQLDLAEDEERRANVPELCPRPDANVRGSHGKKRVCIVSGDPHYRNFDGQAYHVQNKGSFVAAKVSGRGRYDFDVQYTTVRCGRKNKAHPTYGWVSCSKTVAVSFGAPGKNTVLYIDMWKRKMMINGQSVARPGTSWRTFGRGNLRARTVHYKHRKRVHKNYFLDIENPDTGLKVRAYATVIIIEVPKYYWGKTEGMCGNADGKRNSGDFRDRRGRKYKIDTYNSRSIKTRRLSKWQRIWSVSKKESAFPSGLRARGSSEPNKTRKRMDWKNAKQEKEAHKFCRSLSLHAQEYFNCMEDMRHSGNDKKLAREQSIVEEELHKMRAQAKGLVAKGRFAVLSSISKVEIDLYRESQNIASKAVKIRTAQNAVRAQIRAADRRIASYRKAAQKARKIRNRANTKYQISRGKYRAAVKSYNAARRSVKRRKQNIAKELRLIALLEKNIRKLGNGQADISAIESAAARLSDMEEDVKSLNLLQDGKFKRHHSEVSQVIKVLAALKAKLVRERRGLDASLRKPRRVVNAARRSRNRYSRIYRRKLAIYNKAAGKLSAERKTRNWLAGKQLRKAKAADNRATKNMLKDGKKICAELKQIQKIRALIVKWINKHH